MRKKLSLVAASVAVAFGAGLGAAVPASAATPAIPSYYNSQADCLAAKAAAQAATGRQDLYCNPTVGHSEPGSWVLAGGFGGG